MEMKIFLTICFVLIIPVLINMVQRLHKIYISNQSKQKRREQLINELEKSINELIRTHPYMARIAEKSPGRYYAVSKIIIDNNRAYCTISKNDLLLNQPFLLFADNQYIIAYLDEDKYRVPGRKYGKDEINNLDINNIYWKNRLTNESFVTSFEPIIGYFIGDVGIDHDLDKNIEQINKIKNEIDQMD